DKSMAHDQTGKFLTDLAEARRKKKRRYDSPKTPPGSPPHQPPPPPPLAGPSGTLGSSGDSGSSQVLPPPPPPPTRKTTSDTRFKPSLSLIPEDLHMDDDSDPNEHVHSSDDEDIRNDYIPIVNLMQDWWKPLSEEDRLATPEPAWSIPSSDLPVLMNNWVSALASSYAPPPENSLLAQTVLSLYGYDYMKKIVFRKADLKEFIIAKRDFRYLYSSDFEDFDGTLHQINEALDYRVKEFKVNTMNPGLNIRFWTRKDVDKSKEFMFAIQKRLKTRRIFRNLESFIGGRVREGDYRLL
nr:hypothetical protein [Tanacetum cinerariifolium]